MLITIQSLLSEKPYFNEPGITKVCSLQNLTRLLFQNSFVCRLLICRHAGAFPGRFRQVQRGNHARDPEGGCLRNVGKQLQAQHLPTVERYNGENVHYILRPLHGDRQ